MDSAILYFNQLFVFEAIDKPKQPFQHSRFDKRTSTILHRQPVSKRYCRGIRRLSLKPKNATQKKPKPEKCSCHERESTDLSFGLV